MKKFLACALFASAIIITACTDGSIIGNDLLGDEEINLEFEDIFDLTGQTVLGDSIATYSVNTTNQTYMLGEVDEPIFGKYSSDIYTGLTLNVTFPNMENSVIDSVVLDLEYDSLGFYGDANVVHNIKVYTLTEDILDFDTIYSNQTFQRDLIPIGSISLVPSLTDNIDIKFRDLDPEVDSTITLSPRLRIKLDDAFGTQLIEDTEAQGSIDILEENFKGLYIRSTTDGSSMIGLNFHENPDFNDGIARLHVYYTKTVNGSEVLEDYSYLLRAATSSTFIHDYSNSQVGTAIDDPDKGDEFLYCHNMAGVNAEIDIPDLNFLDNNDGDTIIVNSAQLVLTVNEDVSEFETDIYPPSVQFLLSKKNENGEGRVLIDDVIKNGIDLATGIQLLDGIAREGTDDNGNAIKTVTFNITTYVQNLLKNDITTSKITISPIGRSESPRRTVFYGLNHPDYPAKLRIAYTKI